MPGSLAAALALVFLHFLAIQLFLRILFRFLSSGAHPNVLTTILFGALALVLTSVASLALISTLLPGFVQSSSLAAQLAVATVLLLLSAPTYLSVTERKTIDVGHGVKMSKREFAKYLRGR